MWPTRHCMNGALQESRARGERLDTSLECWTCRGPFGYVAASLREAATPLRMTFIEDTRIFLNNSVGMSSPPATARLRYNPLIL